MKIIFYTLFLIVVSVSSTLLLVTQPFVKSHNSLPAKANPGKLETHVKHLSSSIYPRSFEQLNNLEKSSEYIMQHLQEFCSTVTQQTFAVEESVYSNVIAQFGPESGPLMVIGAHYDTDGDANEGAKHPSGYSLQTHTPGADDNASGIAGLLELARMLHLHPPKRRIQLVAYTLEEMPNFRTRNMGSVHHAEALSLSHKKVELMLSLEMIGYFDDSIGSKNYPIPLMDAYYPGKGNFIATVGRFGDFRLSRKVKSIMSGATNLPVYSINAPAVIPGIDLSDHRNFWSKGYPALMVTDTSFYRNPHYHGPADTYEKLDYQRMAKVVESVFAVIHEF